MQGTSHEQVREAAACNPRDVERELPHPAQIAADPDCREDESEVGGDRPLQGEDLHGPMGAVRGQLVDAGVEVERALRRQQVTPEQRLGRRGKALRGHRAEFPEPFEQFVQFALEHFPHAALLSVACGSPILRRRVPPEAGCPSPHVLHRLMIHFFALGVAPGIGRREIVHARKVGFDPFCTSRCRDVLMRCTGDAGSQGSPSR